MSYLINSIAKGETFFYFSLIMHIIIVIYVKVLYVTAG